MSHVSHVYTYNSAFILCVTSAEAMHRAVALLLGVESVAHASTLRH